MFRAGDLPNEYKKARFQLILIARIIGMGAEMDQLGSNKIEKKCEALKQVLHDDRKALKLFAAAIEVFRKSGVDQTKSRYKAETDTDMLIKAAAEFARKDQRFV
jgi:hypothetical protein